MRLKALMPCEGDPSSLRTTHRWKIALKHHVRPLYEPAGPFPDFTLVHSNGVMGKMSPSAVKFFRFFRYFITQSRVGALPHAARASPNITPLANPITENVDGSALPAQTGSFPLLHRASA